MQSRCKRTVLCCLFIGMMVAVVAVGDELRIRFDSPLESLDPAFVTHTRDYAINCNIYSTLVRFEPGSDKQEIVGDLAEEWEISEDGLEYTFYLRQGVQWHHGYGELTAEDVKYSIERVRDPATGSPHSWVYEKVEDIVVVDPYTVRLHLSQEDPSLLSLLAPFRQAGIVNRDAVEEYGETYGIAAAVGTGPFMLRSITPQEIVLDRNMDYYGDLALIERVIFKIVPDDMTAVLALRAGEVDMLEAWTLDELERVERAPEPLEIDRRPGMVTYAIAMNTKQPPLDNLKVRQAIAYGVDQFELVEALLGDTAEPSTNFVAPGYAGHVMDLPVYDRDVERAKALLEEAGYPQGLQLTVTSTERFVNLWTGIQAQLDEVGITLNIRAVDVGTWVEQVMTKGEYELTSYSLGGRPAETAIFLRQVMHSSAFPPGLNYVWYDAVDELIEEAEITVEEDARLSIYRDIQQQISADLPVYPLYWRLINVARWYYVRGFEIDVFHWVGDGLEYVYIER